MLTVCCKQFQAPPWPTSRLTRPAPPTTPNPKVMPFVTNNIAKTGGVEDWRWREAATFAFGSIMEGPSPAQLVQMVQQAMPFLLQVRRRARAPAGCYLNCSCAACHGRLKHLTV